MLSVGDYKLKRSELKDQCSSLSLLEATIVATILTFIYQPAKLIEGELLCV